MQSRLTKLGNICRVINGRAYKKEELLAEGPTPVLRVGNFFTSDKWYYSNLQLDPDKYCDNGDLLYAWSASFGPRIWSGGKVIFHYHIWKMQPDLSIIDQRWLYYWLMWDTEQIKAAHGVGATMLHVTKGAMEARDLSVPSLADQKRTVAVLDEAFEAINNATAYAERNVSNAKELFSNRVGRIFSTPPKSWNRGLLEGACEGFDYGTATKSQRTGGIPVLRMGNIQSGAIDWSDLVYSTDLAETKKYELATDDVLFNRTNSAEHVGKAAIYKGEHRAIFAGYLIRIRYDRKKLNGEFLNYFLNSPTARNHGKTVMAQSVNQANISGSKLRNYPFSYPNIATQEAIVEELRNLQSLSNELALAYEKKLQLLAELKKSLLHKAFSGELTTSHKADSPAAQSTADSLTPSFSADILAFAYSKHVLAKRDRTLGRVKGQKILHLIESVANVDLGREPIKDAAGPNDSAHMRRAEQWAAENDYFSFVQRTNGVGYDFKRGKAFDRLLAGSHARLASHRAEISHVIDLVVSMDSEDAEVLATVHAAWNNLILDGVEPTREALLHEARENWAPSKLKIAEAKFDKAIRFIRKNNLIPDGSSKPVRAKQESLF